MAIPKGKYIFGMVKVGEKGQIVIPSKARKVFDIKPGDGLMVLGDENQGIAIVKADAFLQFAQEILSLNEYEENPDEKDKEGMSD